MKKARPGSQARELLGGRTCRALLARLEPLLARGASAEAVLDGIAPVVARGPARNAARAKAGEAHIGRTKIAAPENFRHILAAVERREITVKLAARLCGVSPATFYRMKKEAAAGRDAMSV